MISQVDDAAQLRPPGPPLRPGRHRRASAFVRCGACAVVCALAARAPAAEPPALRATLATTDVRILIEAAAEGPRLRTLAGGGLVWAGGAAERLPAHLGIDSRSQPLEWRLDAAACRFEPREIDLVYESVAPALRLTWRWRARADFGPLEHTVLIENRGSEPLWLPLVPTWRFDFAIDPRATLERFWVEKGADAPSSAGTHRDTLREGDAWEGTSSPYARPLPGRPREMIPYVLVDAPASGLGWYLGIEFSGRTHIALERSGGAVRGEAGLDPNPAPYRTRLPAGATFATPAVFVGAATGGPDGAGNQLRRWVRSALGNPRALEDPAYPLMVSNSWGSGTAVDETLARRMIASAAALGLEMFHLDAGWFRDVGDWRADPEKFPHGIANLADFAHRRGLRFGLWVDWAQAGTSHAAGALAVDDPARRDWLIADPPPGWRHTESFKGITIDLGVPQAAAWVGRELERIVSDYHLDMLEHDGYLVAQGSTRADHAAAAPDPATLRVYQDSGFLWVDSSNATDVSDHATRAYYALYERLRARHPGLLLEICNDGGRMVDFGSAAHGDYFSITDIYDPVANRRAFYDASYVLPPAMLESYVGDWPAASLASFRYMLRSGMLGWFSLMQDASRWNGPRRAAARGELMLYRTVLRPLIRSADLYHVSNRPDGVHWDGIEYWSGALHRGVLYAFRGSAPGEPTHRFLLQGLEPRARYHLRFQDRGPGADRTVSGAALRREGLRVSLTDPLTSELVLIQRAP
ncbi:MAG TPA: alpha-galactosidase [Steroidobacteraceae bacterium]|nr:alpha-galactosidase [Steroidobacteraceae bacterium]